MYLALVRRIVFGFDGVPDGSYRQASKFYVSHFEQILAVRLAYEGPMKTGRQQQHSDPERIDLLANAPQPLFRCDHSIKLEVR